MRIVKPKGGLIVDVGGDEKTKTWKRSRFQAEDIGVD